MGGGFLPTVVFFSAYALLKDWQLAGLNIALLASRSIP